MIHPLVRTAYEVLGDPTSTPTVQNVAGTTLMTAVDEGLVMPVEYLRAVWSWLRTTTATTYWTLDALAENPDPVVRAEALHILKDPHTGTHERRLAVQVLGARGHASYLDDHTLLDLVERTKSGLHALDLKDLLERVHHARGIPEEVARSIRDRWTSSSDVGMREAAIEVGIELLPPDLRWIDRVLADPDPDVRSTMAGKLTEETEGLQELLQQRLRAETSPDARAALHRAIADQQQVESDRERRRRRRARLRDEAEEASQDGGEGSDPK